MPDFSRRSGRDRSPNPLASAIAAARDRGRRLCNLTASNPTTLDLPYDAGLLEPLAHPRGRRYRPDPRGLPAAREAVAALFRDRGVAVEPEHVVMTASSSESYGFLFKLLCDPGDQILVPRPSYPLFDLLADLDVVSLRPYRLGFDGRWGVDLHGLREATGPRTRAVLVVHPNNPTGSFLSRRELEEIARLGLPIVSDEVFTPYVLDGGSDRAESALEAAGDTLIFSLGGLSKRAGLPQLKLGWIAVAGPAAIRDEALARLELIGDTYLSASTPVQEALPELLSLTRPTQDAIRQRVRANRDALSRRLGRGGLVELLPVAGGWYAILRLPRVMDDVAWAARLVEEDGVITHPGAFFGFDHGAWLVVSLLTREADLASGVARIAARVEAVSGA